MDMSINILNMYNIYTYILCALFKEAQRALCTLNYSLDMSAAGIECRLLTVQHEVSISRTGMLCSVSNTYPLAHPGHQRAFSASPFPL